MYLKFTMADHSNSKDLKMDQIQKAFDETCKTFERARSKDTYLTGVKLVLITEEYYDMALKFAREHFMTQEPMHTALGIQWTDEYKDFWLDPLKLNLSLMFINEQNDEPMAIRTTQITRYDDNSKIDLDKVRQKPLEELLRFCIYCDDQADFFGHFGIKEAFHFIGLGVAEKYRRRGLATHLSNVALDMILNFGIDPVYVKVEATSNFSKRIFENSGFETLFEQPFATWEVDGKFPLLNENTEIHKSLKMYGKKYTKNVII